MRIFVYKTIVVLIASYFLYNFTIGKKIDQYESNMVYFFTDQGREAARNLFRKEIKNSLDNENLLKDEDRILIKQFIKKLKSELQ
tara:strand:+ start:1156 stop:1410 length:255 start_codon:yes stop_codon:yes gene_type:complete